MGGGGGSMVMNLLNFLRWSRLVNPAVDPDRTMESESVKSGPLRTRSKSCSRSRSQMLKAANFKYLVMGVVRDLRQKKNPQFTSQSSWNIKIFT